MLGAKTFGFGNYHDAQNLEGQPFYSVQICHSTIYCDSKSTTVITWPVRRNYEYVYTKEHSMILRLPSLLGSMPNVLKN